MKLLITGGLGHIGSHLIRHLHQHEITVVDNLSTERYCSLFQLPREIEFREMNFADLTVDEISEFDAIIHLAAKTNAVASFNDNGATEKTNLIHTREFIDKVEKSKCRRFIFPSSTSVYGMGNETKKEDDRTVLSPQSPYALTKLVIEVYLETSQLDYTILRCGTIFGTSPGMRFHTAINKFCWCAVTKQEIPVWRENLDFYRPYLSLCDVRRTIVSVLDNPQTVRQTYNVVSQNRKMRDILDLIQGYFKDSLKLKMIDTPLLNQHSYFVSKEKLEKVGIFTNGSIEDGILQTISHLSGVQNG